MSLISEGIEKITKAKTKLVLKHPFFAIIALGLIFRNAKEDGMPMIDTMATDGKHCWWDEEFVATLTVNEVMGVIAHEVLHCVFLHIVRRLNRHPLIWNIAGDYAINHVVLDAGMTLPANGLFKDKYRNWLVDAIYDDLEKNQPDLPEKWRIIKLPPQAQGNPCDDGTPGPGSKPGDQEGKDGEGNQPGKPGKGNKQQPMWGVVLEPRNDDGSPMSEADKSELIEELKIKVIQAAEAAKSVGKLPASLNGLIKAIGKPTVNWKEYIQSWVSGKIPDDYTWKRPNRKMLGLYNMILPSMQLNGCGVGVLSIDTSGSVSDGELKTYAREIMGMIELCNPEKIYIMQHDVRVNKVDVWEQGDTFDGLKITNRGGTCVKPSFKYAMEKIDEEINWMICFTDMAINDFPSAKDAPDFPVLWAATGPDCAPFGTYLPLKDALSAVS